MRPSSTTVRLLVGVLALAIAAIAQPSVHIQDARLTIVRDVLKQAVRVAEAIPEDEQRENTLSLLAADLAGLGDTEGALSAAEGIRPEVRPSALVYITRQLARRGEMDKAFYILDRIEDPDVRLEAAQNLASARAWEGDISTALQIVHSTLADSPAAKARLLVDIGRVQARLGDPAGAAVTFDQAEQAAAEEPDERHRMHLLGQVATIRSAVRDRRGAVATTRRMETEADRLAGSSAQDQALAEVAQARARTGEPVEPGDVAGIEQPNARAFALRRIAGAQAFAGRTAEAFDTIAAIESGEEKDGALADVADTQARHQKNFEVALQTAARIELPTIRARTLASLASLQVLAGDKAGAAQTLTHAQEALRAVPPDHHERDEALGRVAVAVAEIDSPEAARQLVAAIADPLQRQNPYMEIALAEAFFHQAAEPPAWISDLDSPAAQANALRGFALGLMQRVRADYRQRQR